MDLKKEKSKAETTEENIGKLYFIRMKDWYALEDAIKWHQGKGAEEVPGLHLCT